MSRSRQHCLGFEADDLLTIVPTNWRTCRASKQTTIPYLLTTHHPCMITIVEIHSLRTNSADHTSRPLIALLLIRIYFNGCVAQQPSR